MNYDLIFLLLFYLLLLIIFKIFRNKFEVQSKVFVLCKTKLGLNLMNNIAKKIPKTLKFIGTLSIIIGFIGMVFTVGIIFNGTYTLLTKPNAPPQLAPVIPGVNIDGLPNLSFWHWIISIFIVAVIHEFSHGVYARLSKVRIKSSGFAFLGPILAAFVEPDEKQMNKIKTKDQLKILSAGPFSNIFLAIVVILFMILVISPVNNYLFEVKGINLASLNQSFPIASSGIKFNDTIIEINNVKLNDIKLLTNEISKYKPGDIVNVKTESNDYKIKLGVNPSNYSIGALGVAISGYKVGPKEFIKNRFVFLVSIFSWFSLLVFWLFNISLGVGLFNLLPLGPVDGGRMFYVATLHFLKDKKKALRLLNFVSLIMILLIIINLSPFIIKLFKFLFNLLLILF